MLRMSGSLLNRPVMSLRISQPIATAVEPIINPHNLKILGWWCKVPGGGDMVLLCDDVRENGPHGLVVNDDDVFSTPDELVRHKEVLNIRFNLIGKTVKTKRSKIGRVENYSYDDSMFVQKIYVERSLVKVFASEDTVIIDRTQILEVTDDYILVRDTEVTSDEMAPAGAMAPSS
jgi:hypothetical protein